MITGHQLAFRFREIERQPARLGDAGNHEDHQAEELRDAEPQPPLGFHNRREVKGAAEHDHAHQRQAHEHLIAQHLRCGSQSSQQGVLVV